MHAIPYYHMYATCSPLNHTLSHSHSPPVPLRPGSRPIPSLPIDSQPASLNSIPSTPRTASASRAGSADVPPTPVGGDLESWRVEEPVETSQQFFVSNIPPCVGRGALSREQHRQPTAVTAATQPLQPCLSNPAQLDSCRLDFPS